MRDRTHFRARLKYQRRLFQVSRLYLRGKTQKEIARHMNITQARVSILLKGAFKVWQELSNEAVDLRIAEELAKINELELTYREAWEKSLTTAKKRKVVKRKDPMKQLIELSETDEKEEQFGNPAFLAGIERCIDRRLKLIGANSEGDGGMPISEIIFKMVERQEGDIEDVGETGEGEADIHLSQGPDESMESD